MPRLSPLRVLPTAFLLCAAAGAALAQSPLSDAQTRYMGAYVFERQIEVFRRYCAGDAAASRALETGVSAFHSTNPDYAAALAAAPTDADFVAGVEAFDARFAQMAEAMHAYLALQPPQTRCPELATNLGRMRFAAMIDEASDSAAAAVTASVP